MICLKCKAGEHAACNGCTCQHRTVKSVALYSERVAKAISLGSVGAVVLNADAPTWGDC